MDACAHFGVESGGEVFAGKSDTHPLQPGSKKPRIVRYVDRAEVESRRSLPAIERSTVAASFTVLANGPM